MKRRKKAAPRPDFVVNPRVFNEGLAREILLGERRRETILAIIYSVLMIVSVGLINFFPDVLDQPIQLQLTLLLAGATIYELLMWAVSGLTFKRRRRMPVIPRYINAVIELSIVSAVIVLIAETYDPVNVLITPLALVYFVFIILAAMRLDVLLCIFTGVVAAAEYLAIVYYYLPQIEHIPGVGIALLSLDHHIAKASIMVVSGLGAGFVSILYRRRVIRLLYTAVERNRILGIFGQHVSPEVVNQLLAQSAADEPSQSRYVTVMFLDLRDFTSYAAHRDPQEVINYLNTMFEIMITIINDNQGVIFKYLGDGLMAVFGAPLDDNHSRQHAVTAGLQIIDAIEAERSDKFPKTVVGIGIHAGEAVVGNMGATSRKEYTVVGDVVNLASRIEQLTKELDANLVVTEEIWKVVRRNHPRAIDLGEIVVRGYDEPRQLYRLA